MWAGWSPIDIGNLCEQINPRWRLKRAKCHIAVLRNHRFSHILSSHSFESCSINVYWKVLFTPKILIATGVAILNSYENITGDILHEMVTCSDSMTCSRKCQVFVVIVSCKWVLTMADLWSYLKCSSLNNTLDLAWRTLASQLKTKRSIQLTFAWLVIGVF